MVYAGNSGSPSRVFVFLSSGFGATRWESAWRAGKLPGICDRLPYGYFHAANEFWSITYSEDREESAAFRFLRKGLLKIIGFDLIHAWHNRRELLTSDVVWTHTEREYLAVLCLWRLLPPKSLPKIVAQSVWLFDRWKNFSPLRRGLYQKLISGADVLTALSPENLNEARKLFTGKRCELVRFGIDPGCLRPASRRQLHHPIRLLSLGTDMHRDWDTLIEAVRNWTNGEVRIASRKIRMRRSWPDNVVVVTPATAQDVKALYDWADFVVVPVKRNLHASGITVVCEAVLFGLPVICTDTGGLRAYFSEKEIGYVAPGDPRAIRSKIEELAVDDDQRFELTVSAQRRIFRSRLTSYAYAIRHRDLSESILYPSAKTSNQTGSFECDRVANSSAQWVPKALKII